ncbi:hypothetical protein EDC01DRAFT_731543 [Geopyxis carbonaria]|nr:hypothetical protein EDC01DRAFT_731543 [Geopyxis carbonaria]
MPRPSRTDTTFVLLALCTGLVLCIFCLAASKVAREAAVGVHIFWAIVFTLSLCIISLLYFTLLITFYPALIPTVGALITNFALGVAWAIALVAEIVDPNNIIASKRRKGGEALVLFRVRVALSGCVSVGLLAMTLVAGVKAMRWGGVGRDEWELRRRSELPEDTEADSVVVVEEGSSRAGGTEEAASGGGGGMRGVLVRVGILKQRLPPTTTTNGAVTTEA